MSKKLTLSITYEPSELLNGISTSIIKGDFKSDVIAYRDDTFLDFIPSSYSGLLPPVTKYISPAGKHVQYILIERKPDYIKVSEDVTVPVPWNYFLAQWNRVGHCKVCWFFRDDQVYTPEDPLGLSWLSKKSFEECNNDIIEYIDSNWVYSGIFIDMQDLISKVSSINMIQKNFNAEAYGAKMYADMMGIAPTDIFQHLSDKTVNDVMALNFIPELNVNHIHKEAVKSASDSVLSLTEMILSGTTGRDSRK